MYPFVMGNRCVRQIELHLDRNFYYLDTDNGIIFTPPSPVEMRPYSQFKIKCNIRYKGCLCSSGFEQSFGSVVTLDNGYTTSYVLESPAGVIDVAYDRANNTIRFVSFTFTI